MYALDCPDLFFQFYVLFGERSDFIVSCSYLILPNKQTTTYIEALSAVKNIIKPIDDFASLPMNPIYKITDFELAMQNAPKKQFPF
jgi:hypothetical protein